MICEYIFYKLVIIKVYRLPINISAFLLFVNLVMMSFAPAKSARVLDMYAKSGQSVTVVLRSELNGREKKLLVVIS